MAKRHGNKKIALILKKGQVIHRGYVSKYIDEEKTLEEQKKREEQKKK